MENTCSGGGFRRESPPEREDSSVASRVVERQLPHEPRGTTGEGEFGEDAAGNGAKRLHEHAHVAAAHEPDRDAVVIGVAEGVQLDLAGPQALERSIHHRTLDAAARHRTDRAAVIAHRHRRSRRARHGAGDLDDRRDRPAIGIGQAVGVVGQTVEHEAPPGHDPQRLRCGGAR
ncbi:hypothetical protein QFZ53_000140 [Microbacterium natoriense]|uniref:Uncharacterized protein n=1 Tax=Microbacterium natoriense TaxID=284570 RepID=A0AAW8ETJ9_9MICO|nr:hypothetical protein [Microbacterium natoriense]MDQ0645944.1 hypothetical protein [Microbacterium natoriense]